MKIRIFTFNILTYVIDNNTLFSGVLRHRIVSANNVKNCDNVKSLGSTQINPPIKRSERPPERTPKKVVLSTHLRPDSTFRPDRLGEKGISCPREEGTLQRSRCVSMKNIPTSLESPFDFVFDGLKDSEFGP